MKTAVKKTYLLPSDVVAEFERHAAPGKRGVAVAEALRHWTAEKKRQELRQQIEESFNDPENMALYEQIEREWAPLSDEVWAQIDDDWSQMSAEEMDREFPQASPSQPSREPHGV